MQKLLVIDDSPEIHDLVRQRLRHEDIELYSASEVFPGLRTASRVRPDLILIDLDMSGASAIEICRELQSELITRHIPVIFLLTGSSADKRQQAQEAGAWDLISKPIDPIELQLRVRAALRTKYLMELLATRAQIDPTTGLWNRQYLEQLLLTEQLQAKRVNRPLSCIMIEVDDLKSTESGHGHRCAEAILQWVAGLAQETCRGEDYVCRYSPEQIAILALNTRESDAVRLAERLHAKIADHPMPWRDQTIQVTCSLGVAHQKTTPPPTVVELAAKALEVARKQGGNRVELAAEPLKMGCAVA